MPGGSSNGGRSGGRNNGKKQESKAISDLRNACPDHKKGDFDQLVRQLKGDEAKISEKIQEWWEEPHQPQEEKWEEINKKPATKLKHTPGVAGVGAGAGGKFRGDRDRGGRSSSNGEGRGRGGRGRGGRGGRGDRKLRDSNSPPNKHTKDGQEQPAAQRDETSKKDSSDQQAPQERMGIPKPVTNAPALKGAWGRALGGQPAPGPSTPASPEKAAAQPQEQQPVSAAPQPPPPKKEPVVTIVESLDVGMVTKNDPTPAGLAPTADSKPKPVSGNVWATKGSAHLIQAEKPKPPAPIQTAPVAVQPVVSAVPSPFSMEKAEPPALPTSEPVMEEEPVSTMEEAVASLETGLPPAVATVAGGWGSEPAVSAKAAPTTTLEVPPLPEAVVQPSPLNSSIAPPSVPAVEEPAPSPAKPQPSASKPPRPAPTNVLNMGHWETGDNDGSADLDFGFGSFGTENDVVSSMEQQAPQTDTSSPPTTAPVPNASSAASAVSPARPPPGLSIGGMPPMPANAVLVHELETSLENAALNAPKPDQQAPAPQEKPLTNHLPPQPVTQVPAVPTGAAPVLAGGQNYNQYGMAGMYNYSAPGSGFVGVHAPAGPFLGVGVVPQQQPPKVGANSPQPGATPSGPGSNLPPAAGLYAQHGSAPSSGNAPDINAVTDANVNGSNSAAAAAAGMPPGMPGMPYNPALYYGQQPFHLGQHQGGMGYNYGYGQFGAVQGGFGYQQVMGQGAGYGAPHYADDGQHQQGPPHQGHQGNAHHSGGSGGYQKNTGGGYRGRNNHHNNNQYQNQYNPQQHGGYGGQPYGMGHYNDHFNQRGGYGHANMGDMYGMQQQQQQQQPGIHAGGGGGFQDDNDHQSKGRRGGNNRNSNNNSLNQFQGGPHGQLSGAGQQAPFGLQGHANDSAPTAPGGAGWSNNNNNNTQAGGWSGGTTGWQQGS